ncbi:MAG: aryl-sulfate sulfotransferase [Nocardiopsaceae bacterium]|nr:aryl-sulfate sulfotransferase [Nocardiopsaceae bacterium]
MIMDWNGQVVWFSPTVQGGTNNLAVQSYQGRPVLTWFDSQPVTGGILNFTPGTYTIADETYTPIATVSAVGSGYAADTHECVLTSNGTAYITAGRQASADLTAVGGPASGQILDYCVQEIDIATGNLLFQWNGLANIPVEDTYLAYSPGRLFDPYHFNSIGVAPDGNLLVSARNTCTVYKVSRRTGAIMWRLGGKRSSFAMGPGTSFAWQHDAKPHGGAMVSILDDEAPPTASRAIFVVLDTSSMRASLARQYTRPGGAVANLQGSVQSLDGGRVLVGWGEEPYATEFSHDGQVLWEAQFPVISSSPEASYQSYRTLSFDWSGTPADPPDIAVTSGAGSGTTVYASWNGATEVATWTVLAGSDPSALAPAATAARTGFETSIPVTSAAGPYYAVIAENAKGRELRRSSPVTLGAATTRQ